MTWTDKDDHDQSRADHEMMLDHDPRARAAEHDRHADNLTEIVRARMNAAWKWPERSSWITLQRMLPDLEHAAARAGWHAPHGARLHLKTPAAPDTAACLSWTNAPNEPVPGGGPLADTAAASRLILIGRIQAYESLGDIIEDGYTRNATTVTPITRNPR